MLIVDHTIVTKLHRVPVYVLEQHFMSDNSRLDTCSVWLWPANLKKCCRTSLVPCALLSSTSYECACAYYVWNVCGKACAYVGAYLHLWRCIEFVRACLCIQLCTCMCMYTCRLAHTEHRISVYCIYAVYEHIYAVFCMYRTRGNGFTQIRS
jgi:hypothetical protein